jgi:hypothetical protein
MRFLRNPFVSIFLLYNLLLYLQGSGYAFMFSPDAVAAPGMPLFLASGQLVPLVTGVFIITNLLLVYLTYTHFIERRSVNFNHDQVFYGYFPSYDGGDRP